MKNPRPSFLEVLLGRTVEIEFPGTHNRRRVSKKWFDTMIAEGQVKPVTTNKESQLVSSAEVLVRVARVGPVGLFVPLLDRFPQLAKAKPEDWDFFLGVASVFVGLAQYQAYDSSQDRNRLVRRLVAEEVLKWRSDALDALKDCEGFVARSMEALLQGGKSEWQDALSKSIGVWVCWNVLRRKPEEAADLELATATGVLALKITEGCWEDCSEEAAQEGQNLKRADPRNRVLLATTIIGGGIILGVMSETLVTLGLASAIIGILLNGYFLVRLVITLGKLEKLPVILVGSVPAGLFDAARIFLIGILVRWIVQ